MSTSSASQAQLTLSIESAVQDRSLLQHTFYRAWSDGALTIDQLKGYAKEYYWAAKHVPAVMDAIKKNFPKNLDATARATFDHNAGEEVEHIELWERFSSALGITKKELDEYAPTETVMEAVYSIVEAAEASFEEGIAAMYAFEVDLPAISESKIEGLQKFYGLSSEDAHAYFNEHLAEEKHLCLWRSLLNQVPEKKVASALVAAKSTVNAQNKILDGVVERYCPELCECAA